MAAAEGWGGRRCPLSPPGPAGDAGRDSHTETKVLAWPGKRRHRRALRGDDNRDAPCGAGLGAALPDGLGGPYSAGPLTIAAATSAGLPARDGPEEGSGLR